MIDRLGYYDAEQVAEFIATPVAVELDGVFEPVIAGGTTAQFWRGDKTWQTITSVATADTLTTARNIAMTGDVAWSVSFDGSANVTAAGTIATGAVSNAKLANMATQTIKGRTTAGTGAPEDLTAAQARSVMGLGTAALQNTGTSGATIPLLNGTNVFSAVQEVRATTNIVQSFRVGTTSTGQNGGEVVFFGAGGADIAKVQGVWVTSTSTGDVVFYGFSGALVESGRLRGNGKMTVTGEYQVAGTKVVGARGAAVADATDAASAITQLNALLARCRAHGLIA